MPGKATRGYTLTEAVAAMALLAAFAAALIPAVQAYVDKAEQLQLLSDARAAVQTILLERLSPTGALSASLPEDICLTPDWHGDVLLHLRCEREGAAVVYCAKPQQCPQHDGSFHFSAP